MDKVKELIIRKEQNIKNEEELEKLNLIKDIIKNEDCFFNMDLETTIGILEFLGVQENEMLNFYHELTSITEYKNNVPQERFLIDEFDGKSI